MPTKKKVTTPQGGGESTPAKKTEKKPVVKKVAKPTAGAKPAPKKAPAAAEVKKSPEPIGAHKPVTATPKPVTSTAKAEKETRKSTASEKQKIRVIIRAFDHKICDESARTIIEAAERTGSLVTGAIPLPTHRELFTLNRATFVHKDARDQFEIKTHKRLIDITEYTPTTIEALSNLNLPAGVDVEIKML